MLTGNLVALAVVLLVVAIILKVSKKVISFLLLVAGIVLIMHFVVPMVM